MLIVYLTTINHRITICFFLVKPSRKGSSHEASVVEGELPSYLHSYHLVWGPRSVPWYLWVSSKKSADGLVFTLPNGTSCFFFNVLFCFHEESVVTFIEFVYVFKAIYGCFIGFSRDFSVLQSVTVFSELWWFMMILSYYIYMWYYIDFCCRNRWRRHLWTPTPSCQAIPLLREVDHMAVMCEIGHSHPFFPGL